MLKHPPNPGGGLVDLVVVQVVTEIHTRCWPGDGDSGHLVVADPASPSNGWGNDGGGNLVPESGTDIGNGGGGGGGAASAGEGKVEHQPTQFV